MAVSLVMAWFLRRVASLKKEVWRLGLVVKRSSLRVSRRRGMEGDIEATRVST
jgi:hypothetical protein